MEKGENKWYSGKIINYILRPYTSQLVKDEQIDHIIEEIEQLRKISALEVRVFDTRKHNGKGNQELNGSKQVTSI